MEFIGASFITWFYTAQPTWCIEHLVAPTTEMGLKSEVLGTSESIYGAIIYGLFSMGTSGKCGFSNTKYLAFDL